MPVQSRAIEKRNRILAAAFKIIGEKGYARTDTVDIARAAGISVGTLYAYFRDKRDIFIEASAGFHAEVLKRLEANLPKDKASADLVTEIRSVLSSFMSIDRESRFFQKEFVALSFSDEEIRRLYHARRMDFVDYLLPRLRKACGRRKPTRVGLFLSVSFLQDLFYQIDRFPEYGFAREEAFQSAEKAVSALLLEG
jgi:AcrR family transcriptional regulator